MSGEVEAALAEVLDEHVRGDWSDRTYTCQGCSERTLAALDAGDEPLSERRAQYALVSHPGWSLGEYHDHVAAALAPVVAKVWDEGFEVARTLARCYGHTDHWEGEPQNPYRNGGQS